MKVVISCILLVFSFLRPCFGQELKLEQKDDHLWIHYTGMLQLTYLPADQFQALGWEPGYAYYLDGSSRQFDGMKYDPETDKILVSTGGHVLTLLPGVVNGVSMEKGDIITRIFVKVPLEKPVFMEILSVGKIHLLIYRKTKDEEMDMYLQTDQTNLVFDKVEKPPAEFDEILYVWNKDGVSKFNNPKKAISKLMNDKSEKIDSFLDKGKIRMKNYSDLMKVFDYYNNL